MSDVNLLIDKKPTGFSEQTVGKIKKVSLGVLVVYLLVAGIYSGWYYFVASRTRNLANELEKLTSEVAGMAQQEVLVKRLNERSGMVTSFIKNRQPLKRFAEVLVGVNTRILEWELVGSSDLQKIKLGLESSDAAYEKLEYLKDFYTNTKLEKVEFKVGDGWTALYTVSGLKS